MMCYFGGVFKVKHYTYRQVIHLLNVMPAFIIHRVAGVVKLKYKAHNTCICRHITKS